MKKRELLKKSAMLLGAASVYPSLRSSVFAAELNRPSVASNLLAQPAATAPFSYALLKASAKSRAQQAYQAATSPLPPALAALNWDQWQSIQFKAEHALWGDTNALFRAQFFHLGFTVTNPVRLYEVENGLAREIRYNAALFDYSRSGLDPNVLPENLGYAGFRLNFHDDWVRDITVFQGASYFRAVGAEKQYGQSARGLAINTAMPQLPFPALHVPEEFPNFVAYYLERPASGDAHMVVHALLDSPSITGAYRFTIRPGENQVMEVEASLYARKSIARIGIAPLTSMYQCGENDRRMAYDWRTEIHDTDGLQLQKGNNEWVWRPLTNPRNLQTSAFVDEQPKGFGLLQRDRNFDHYQDDGVFYNKRPSAWVEPKGNWGKGSVMLVEIPTPDETLDNIVAFWNPAAPLEPGQENYFAYRLTWGADSPQKSQLARVQATRTGLGGVIGRRRTYFSWRFAVDFSGGELAKLPANSQMMAVVTTSRGKLEVVSARPLDVIQGWRAMFDLVPDAAIDPIDLRLTLQLDGRIMTETWLYKYEPPPISERTLV